MKKIFTLFAALAMVMSMSAATKTIYCKMAQSWWKADGAAVGAYYWGTGAAPSWPGVRMTPVAGETDLWSIDIDTDKYQKIIFTRVNGSGTVSDWGAKTADLTVPTDDKNLYTITSTSPVWGDPGVKGNWSVYAPDAPKTYKDITITVVANATPKIHYWEGGDKVVGTEWDAKPEMVATGEENTYSYTIKEVDEATGVKYLVVVGEVQSADQQAFENVTANFKDLLPQVAVMGVTGWTGDKMTVADDYLSASVNLTLEAAKGYELKLTVNGEWFGSNAITITKDNNSAKFDTNGEGNGKLITDLAGDYVFIYTYATKTLVVTYPLPEVSKTITWELNGGELPAVVVPTNAELWEAFKPYYNKYYTANGKLVKDRADQPIDKVSTFAAAYMQEIMTDEKSEYKWLGDYVLGVAAGQGVTLPTDMASANEGAWRWAVHAFFNATAGANGAAGTDFTEAGKPEVWGAAYQAAYGVVLPTEAVEADYTLPTPVKTGFTFVGWYDNAEGEGDAMTVLKAGWSGTIYAIWKQDATTGVDNTIVAEQVVKIVRNGQVLIMVGDKTFNMMGQEVK